MSASLIQPDGAPSSPLGLRDLVATSELFDPAFYLERNPDVAAAGVDPIHHYLVAGWRENRRPGPLFDGAWYLRRYPDVAASGNNPLEHYLTYGWLEGRQPHARTVVYTAIIGNYDQLRVPHVVDPETDYVAFVDDWIVDVPAPWIKRRYIDRHGSDRLTARFIKLHPHRLLPDYDVSMWVDAAYQLRSVKPAVLDALLGPASIALFPHPDRDCVFDEADVVLQHRLDNAEAVRAMVALLESERHPRRGGLAATGLIVRRHRDRAIEEAMERWWSLVSGFSSRDQLSFNFALRQTGIEAATLPGSVWTNDFGEWNGHGPRPWQGLQCGGAYLDAAEYEAIEGIVAELGITSAIETGAGETALLFKRLDVRMRSIESVSGPWSRRARAQGCDVADVPFDPDERIFHSEPLRAALRGHQRVDLIFIDSPVGTENRRRVLEQLVGIVETRYVMYHDVRRDLVNILADQKRHGLQLVRFIDSPRGLAIFAMGSRA